ncbi:hypothetical protein [Mycoplasmopsis bovirhinis]|uniref:hypothetical protein n=1 Tax=Mycoplasmopsis bovirhinis TaxID=29553 RepID=UPI000E76E4CB|nr:hypothetical protein [Mycoplasmopsis bovirhinis]
MIAKLILSISKSNATLVKNIKYSIVFGIVENISNKSSLLTLFKSLIKSIAIDLFFNSLYLEENVNNFVKLVTERFRPMLESINIQNLNKLRILLGIYNGW